VINQAVPFQVSAKVCVMLDPLVYWPTATQLVALVQATPSR
jgi:hypothetical protein